MVRHSPAPPLLPLIFLEPSCWSRFVEDYRELKLPGAEQVAPRCFLFEQFLDDLLKREPDALRFNHVAANLAIHAHCHAKALANPAQATRMLGRLPGRKATLLATGCCGMAGAFGTMESKQALSRQVAEPLVEQIKRQPQNTILVASGTSCRHQIRYLTDATPRHAAEVLAEALASGASP